MLHFIHESMGFYHWVFESCFLSFLSPYYLSLRYVPSLKTTLRPWHHTLHLIALMWAILGIGSRAFWLWWTKSCGMTLHWDIATLESFYWVCNHSVWYIALGCTFLDRGLIFLDDHPAEAYSSQSMMDFWVMVIHWRRLDVFFTLEYEIWLGDFFDVIIGA